MIAPCCPACLTGDAARPVPRSSLLTCRFCKHAWRGSKTELRDAVTAADLDRLVRPKQVRATRRYPDGRFAGRSTVLAHFARILRECAREAT